VITVSLSQGILAVSFVAGLIYLIKEVNQEKPSQRTFWLEAIIYTLFVALGFVIVTITFGAMNYEATFQYEDESELVYHLPAIAGPKGAELVTEGKMEPIMGAPTWMQGKDA